MSFYQSCHRALIKIQALLSLVNRRRVGMFHAFWGPGHNSTEYKRFYAASAGDVYKVTRYQSAYEPYIIFRKDGPPWYEVQHC